MDNTSITVWGVIRRFLLGWAAAGLLLVLISCVKYREFIITAFIDHTWAWVNAMMPMLIVIFGIRLIIRSVFR